MDQDGDTRRPWTHVFPPPPHPQRGRETASPKSPHSREGSQGQSPPWGAKGLSVPHIRRPPWDLHQSWGPQNIQLWNQWDPGVLWGSEINFCWGAWTQRLILETRAKGSSLRGGQIIHEGNSAASLKASARGTGNIPGLSWGGRGAGKRHSAFSPPLGAQRGKRDTASWKLEGVGPPHALSAPLQAGVPFGSPHHSFPKPWFPTGNAWPDWWLWGADAPGPCRTVAIRKSF